MGGVPYRGIFVLLENYFFYKITDFTVAHHPVSSINNNKMKKIQKVFGKQQILVMGFIFLFCAQTAWKIDFVMS